MGNTFSFFLGGFSGVYLAQNYNVPDVKIVTEKVFVYLKEMEKEKKKKNSSKEDIELKELNKNNDDKNNGDKDKNDSEGSNNKSTGIFW